MPRKGTKKKKKTFKPPPAVIVDHSLVSQFGVTKEYEVKKLLGKGGFARVFAVESTSSHNTYAIKVVEKSSIVKEAQKNKIRYEIRIHRELRHKHVVKFERHFEDKDFVYILMEYCNNQTLMELKKRRTHLTEPEVQYYLQQILTAVKYCHKQNVIHRDLKLGNILIDSKMNLKLADFGLAAQLSQPSDRKTTICGTPNYIAPEVLNGNRKGGHSFAVDVWSTGVIMYTLLLGKPPFQTGTVNKTYRRIKTAKYSFPGDVPLSSIAKACIEKMLTKNAADRSTVDQCLADQFFTCTKVPKNVPASALTSKPSGFPQMLTKVPWYKAKAGPNLLKRQRAQAQRANPWAKPETKTAKRQKTENGNKNKNSNSNKAFVTKPGSENTGHRRTKGTPKAPSKADKILPIKNGHPNLFVSEWLDYTRKYGTGYILSNEIVGVHFNDFTKMLLNTETHEVTYIGSRPMSKRGKWPPPMEECTVANCEQRLKKKVTLCTHFANHFNKRQLTQPKRPRKTKEPKVWVDKCVRTKSAMFFILSNGSVQVNFKDNSELILQEKDAKKNTKPLTKSLVTFTDYQGTRATYALDDLLKTRLADTPGEGGTKWMNSLMKRLKYTQDLLTKSMPGDA